MIAMMDFAQRVGDVISSMALDVTQKVGEFLQDLMKDYLEKGDWQFSRVREIILYNGTLSSPLLRSNDVLICQLISLYVMEWSRDAVSTMLMLEQEKASISSKTAIPANEPSSTS